MMWFLGAEVETLRGCWCRHVGGSMAAGGGGLGEGGNDQPGVLAQQRLGASKEMASGSGVYW